MRRYPAKPRPQIHSLLPLRYNDESSNLSQQLSFISSTSIVIISSFSHGCMRLTLLIAMLGSKLLRALHTGMSICKVPLPSPTPIYRAKRVGDQLLLHLPKRSMTTHASIDSSLPRQGLMSSIPSEYSDEDIQSIPTIPLTTEEVELFKLFTDTVRQKKLKTTVRVAGK